ncbi:reverse ribonuclease integrase [Lasius niger]|uniref:Reverse ribonuclease integrase n=1 Tax=Lasius niger TaxID=67767 RepID=A0A0J7KQK4_LASNI|nr:reverse ribonuclease integrase [Lasius niger]
MFDTVKNSFEHFSSEYKIFKHFETYGEFIPPKYYLIGHRLEGVNTRYGVQAKHVPVYGQFIALRKILIGTDLWAKLEITIPPPSLQPAIGTTPTIGIVTGHRTFTTDEARRLEAFLATELPKFHRVNGLTNQAQHQIRLKLGPPIKQRYRPRNSAMQAIIDQEVREMEEEGITEPSTSAWSFPIVIVRKDGRHRFCIDFRKLNAASEKDAYPLSHITATLDKLRGARYLSTLDLKSGKYR